MATGKHKKSRTGKGIGQRTTSGAPKPNQGRPATSDASPRGRFQSWRQRKHPVFRFVVVLLLLLGLFEFVAASDFVRNGAIPGYMRFVAKVTGGVMSVWGEEVTVSGSTISSPRFSVNIKKGCDAVQPTALFLAGVLASPVVFWPKIPGIFLGLLFLGSMNIVRVISLFYIGAFMSQRAFAIMHEDVWQVAFIFLSILAWGLWAVWAAQKTVRREDVTS